MDSSTLLTPTLHVEAAVKAQPSGPGGVQKLRQEIKAWFQERYVVVKIGHEITKFDKEEHLQLVQYVDVADYTGPPTSPAHYNTREVQIDLQTYVLKAEGASDGRRTISQTDDEMPSARVLALPSVALKDEWDSLVFDDGLPARLLRYLVRMVGMMKQPGLNMAAFNWNRLCLLHGPPGSGKSTLSRALAQKLSIRLGDAFPRSTLIEINTNSMLSKYFGESGKLISAAFDRIYNMAKDHGTLICVVMDEVETIAGSRERSTSGTECGDGLRATNQLLTALDRLRHLPNVIVLCTSNLIGAIDQAFLDRVDIKQLIPSPSPAAIYNIFRSCLNELIRSTLIDPSAVQVAPRKTSTRPSTRSHVAAANSSSSPSKSSRSQAPSSSSPSETWSIVSAPEVPSFSEVKVRWAGEPLSPGYRVWAIAQKCVGLSGRTLRRLPILGLAMYTWGGTITLDDAVSALEAAVDQELKAVKGKAMDTEMHDA